MSQTVYVADNPLDLSSWECHKVEDIHAFNMQHWPVWPPTARIYNGSVAISNDVTPYDDASAQRLGSCVGPLYIVVYPAWAQVAAAVIIYAVAWVITQLTNEKLLKPKEQVFAQGSPNNSLSDRENRARMHERIPDGFGTFRSIPDLIMPTYRTIENHRFVEYSWMCVGRGKYSVTDIRENDTPFSQIQNASAVVYPPGQIPNVGTPNFIVGDDILEPVYAVYPVKSVNGQDVPPMNAFYCYGSGLNFKRRQPLEKYVVMSYIRLTASTGLILVPHNGDPDYVTSRIRAGDELQVIFGVLPTGLGPIPDLSAGFYFGANPTAPLVFSPGLGIPPVRGDKEPLIVTSTATRFIAPNETAFVEVRVNIPSSQQAEWAKIAAWAPGVDVDGTGLPQARNMNSVICAQNRWLLGYTNGVADPKERGIFIDDPLCEQVWFNFMAPKGLHLEDGSNRKVLRQFIDFRIRPADVNGNPTGGLDEFGQVELVGSMIGNEQRGLTVKHVRTTPGRCLVIIGRSSMRQRQADLKFDSSSPSNTVTFFFRTQTYNLSADRGGNGPDGDPFVYTPFSGNITDDIKITECYSMSVPVNPMNGVSVTTIHSRVIANESAARVENRQLNCLASRNTGSWNGSVWQPSVIDLQGFVENMLFEAMLDPFIGNRSAPEIDFAGIANAAEAVRAYFGDEDATRFSYTFDDHNMSFEEIIRTMCTATFLTPYRQANVIKCDPDIATDNSRGLFNHRNKLIGTEQRTVTFGMLNDNDGVEQQFTDVNEGIGNVQPISQFLSQAEVVAPVQSRVVGLRFKWQAWWHAYRQLARIIYQSTAVEFDSTEEAALVGVNHRILVEDNTRPDVQDGEIVSISGLVLRTSQPVVAQPFSTYTLQIQGSDGNTEALVCAPGLPDAHSITLGAPPVNPIIVDANFGLPTTYMLVRDQDVAPKAMLVTDKSAKDRCHFTIQAVNYSHMYYHADALTLWIIPSTEIQNEYMFDRSPYEHPNLAIDAMVGSDGVWGPVYQSTTGFLTNSVIARHLIEYSKAVWVQVTSGSSAALLESSTANEELFAIAAGHLVAGHNATNHCDTLIPGTINEWHHYAVTYNSVTAIMRTFIDGNEVDSATVPTRALPTLRAFNSSMHGPLNGKAKYLRHWARELTPAMVRELYQKELLQP